MWCDDYMDKVNDFVFNIGLNSVINICEYSSCRDRIGDDRVVNVVVFYKSEQVYESN